MGRSALHRAIGLGLATLVAWVALLPPIWVTRWQSAIFDALLVAPQPLETPPVFVVEIPRNGPDGEAWTRDDLALLLTRIDSRKPVVIGLDIVLSQGCHNTPSAALAGVSQGLKAPLVFGFLLSDDPTPTLGPTFPIAVMAEAPIWAAAGAEGPCPDFKARSLALTAMRGDVSGRVRSLQAAALVAGRPYPGFAVAVAMLAAVPQPPILGATDGVEGGWLRLGEQTVLLDAQGQFLIAPSDPGDRGTRRLEALEMIADPSPLPEEAVVLIGSVLPEAGGLRPSRIGPLHPTLHLQADGVEQLLAGTLPARPVPMATRGEAGAALLGGGLAILLSMTLPPLPAISATLGLIGLIWGAAIAFAVRGLLIDPLLPSLAIALAAAVALLGEAVLARRRASRLSTRMRRHLPESVVARVDRGDGVVPSETREITALFTDIEGFSSLTQDLPTARLVDLLDSYMTGVTAIVRRHGGMVDKVVGDAVHALFNAPEDLPDHVDHAIDAAIAILHYSRQFQNRPEVASTRFGRTRIGLETGLAQLGDVGQGGHVDYTAYGNAINLAARLQDANKELGTSILIGPAAMAATKRTLHLGPIVDIRSFGPVQVGLTSED